MGRIGSIDVEVVGDRYFSVTGGGHLSLEDSRGVQAELDRLGANHPHIRFVLYDGTTMESFERGLAIHWIRWAATRPRKSVRVAIVTRIPTVQAIASTFRYMLPELRFRVFGERAAAVSFLMSENDQIDPR